MNRKPRRTDKSAKNVRLDAPDRRILNLVQRNSNLSNLELAKRTNLSPPTCLRRLRRLREERVILCDVSLVDPSQVGMGMTVFVEVALERQQHGLQRAFEEKVRITPEIMQCYVVSGDSDFLLVALVSDMESHHAFVKRILVSDQTVRNFRSVVAMGTVKYETAILVD